MDNVNTEVETLREHGKEKAETETSQTDMRTALRSLIGRLNMARVRELEDRPDKNFSGSFSKRQKEQKTQEQNTQKSGTIFKM